MANLLYFRMFSPDNLPAGVHGHRWFFSAQLDQNASFIKSECDVIGALLDGNAPTALQAIV